MNWLVITTSTEEQLKLIYELLFSIDCDWSEGSLLFERYDLAKKLCEAVIKYLKSQQEILEKSDRFSNKKYCLRLYDIYLDALSRLLDTIKNYNPNGTHDGRYFRDEFPYGYRKMLEFFKEVK